MFSIELFNSPLSHIYHGHFLYMSDIEDAVKYGFPVTTHQYFFDESCFADTVGDAL